MTVSDEGQVRTALCNKIDGDLEDDSAGQMPIPCCSDPNILNEWLARRHRQSCLRFKDGRRREMLAE
jgi:hypothetical protein